MASNSGRRSFTLRSERRTEPGQVAWVSLVGRDDEFEPVVRVISPSRAHENTSVWQRDLLVATAVISVCQIASAVEEIFQVVRDRNAHERLPVRGERIL